MIEARGIRYAYPTGTAALDGVSLNAGRGSIVGVVGPNGSGKTTLIKALAGLIHPAEGEILIEGRALSECSINERSRRIAYVAQDERIAFPYTAFEVVLMGRAPYIGALSFESEHDRGIARRAMEQTEILPYATRYVQELSGGERQRVILARALAQEPDVMLLDEPTASLDIKHQMDLYRLLAGRCDEHGLTVVAAIHDLNLASRFCDTIVLLKGGRLVSQGSPRSVLTRDMLRDVFATDVWVGERESDGFPFVLPSLKG